MYVFGDLTSIITIRLIKVADNLMPSNYVLSIGVIITIIVILIKSMIKR